MLERRVFDHILINLILATPPQTYILRGLGIFFFSFFSRYYCHLIKADIAFLDIRSAISSGQAPAFLEPKEKNTFLPFSS